MKLLDNQNFEQVLTEHSIVVVDFFANWCGPCKMLAPVLEEVAEACAEGILIAKVDVDQEKELAAAFNVRSIPTIVFFKDQKVVDVQIGYRTASQILSTIETLK